MTKAEFLKKYGHVEVEFSSYYKFSFTFVGTYQSVNGDEPIQISVGGNSDEIYRMEVCPGAVETIADLDPYCGECGDDEFYDY